MKPIIPIALAALAFFVLRRPSRTAAPAPAPGPDEAPAPDDEPQDVPKRPGKDFVADVGLRGTPKKPGGGLTFGDNG